MASGRISKWALPFGGHIICYRYGALTFRSEGKEVPNRARLNVNTRGGFGPGRIQAVLTELLTARNTARLKGWNEGKSSVCG